MRVAVVGMGKTGLPIAVALQKRGCQITGVEVDAERLQKLRDPEWTPAEPGCSWKVRKDINVTEDLSEAIQSTDLAVVIVQTPETVPLSGVIDLRPLVKVSEQVELALSRNPKPYTLVLSSTVMPGTCDKILAPKVGPYCELLFSPIWIAQGSVVEDYLNPPVLVIGASDSLSSSSFQFFDKVFPNSSPLYTDLTTAESLKLIHNVWCTLKMAFVNEAAQWCAEVGGNPGVIEEFCKSGGERAGTFLRPGPPPGGPCFPRDLRLVGPLSLSPSQSHFHDLVRVVQVSNREGISRLVAAVKGYHTVGIVGLSYKPGVPITEESPSYLLAEELRLNGHKVMGYDPLVKSVDSFGKQGGSLQVVGSLEECVEASDIVIEMHPGAVPFPSRKRIVRPWSPGTENRVLEEGVVGRC